MTGPTRETSSDVRRKFGHGALGGNEHAAIRLNHLQLPSSNKMHGPSSRCSTRRWVMTIQCRNLAGATLAAALALATTAAMAADVTLYQRPNFGGTAVTVHRQAQDLQSTAFNNTATSMVIRDGVWQVCTEANFQGRCVQLQPGAYANLSASLNGSVASVREIATIAATPPATLIGTTPPRVVIAAAPPRVVLFENRNFGGKSIEL